MKFIPKFKKLTAAVALAGVAMSAQAQFSGVISFGDSYSDIGAYNWFSNGASSQTIWAARVAQAYGYMLSTAYPGFTGNLATAPNASGMSFAIGGAQTHDVTGVKGTNTQVADFLARSGGHVDPNGLYLVFIGGNDVNAALGTLVAGQFSNAAIASAQGQMVAAATAVATQVAQLRAAGARNIVVLNLPDFAPLPITQGAAAQVEAGVTQLAGAAAGAQAKQLFLAMAGMLPQIFDQTLEAGLKGQSALTFDTAHFVANLFANPAAFGITNTTIPVCGGSGVNWNNCHGVPSNGALFADALHMTEAGHALLADWVVGALRATSDGMGMANVAANVPLSRSGAQWRAVEGQLRNYALAPQSGARLFVAGDYADGSSKDASDRTAADGTTGTIVIGFENAVSDRTLIGGTIGREQGDFDLAGHGGNLRYNDSALSLYISHRYGDNWIASAAVSHGVLSYDTRRNAVIGPMTAIEKAEFGGRHDSARAQLAYVMQQGGYTHGPFVGADWESVKVDGFNEGTSATAITVGDQSAQRSHARVGYQLAANSTMGLRPYAQLSYDYQLNDSDRTYSVGMGATGSRLTVTQGTQSGGFARLAVGATARIGQKSDLTIGVTSTFDDPAGKDTALTVQWAMPL